MMDKRMLVFGLVALIGVIAASAILFLAEPDNTTYDQGVFDGCNAAWEIQTGQRNSQKCAQVVDQLNLSSP
jgi:hypothetical protein